MKNGTKLTWTNPKNKNKGYIASKWERIYLGAIIVISILSVGTEFVAFTALFGHWYLGALASIIIEVSINLSFGTSALMLYYTFHDKDSWKSYFSLFIFFALIGAGLFFISRSYSYEGGERTVTEWTDKPNQVLTDSTLYNAAKDSIDLSKQSSIDSVNVLYASLLIEDTKHLYKDKKRQPKQLPSFKYGLHTIDAFIEDCKRSKDGTWKKKGYFILLKDKKKLQSILKASKQSNENNKLIALKGVESRYNKQHASNNSELVGLIRSTNEKNSTNDKTYQSKLNSRKSNVYYASWGILGFGILLHYIFYLGKLWAGSTPEYKDKESTEWAALAIDFLLLINIKLFNLFESVFYKLSKGKTIIKKHRHNVSTEETQEEEQDETKDTGHQEQGDNVVKLNPKIYTNIDKQNIVSQGIMQNVSYRELIKLIIKEYGHISEDKIRQIASKVQGYDVSQLKKNTRNFHKRNGDYNGIKYILAEWRLREAGYQVDVVDGKSLEIEQKYVV